MPLVDIPDIGLVDFPDEMSRDTITATIKDKIVPGIKAGKWKSFLDQPDVGATETSPVTAGTLPEADTETITSKPLEQQPPKDWGAPVEIGAGKATIPRFGKEGTITRGVSEIASGLGEFALNRPEELALSVYPPTSLVMASKYLPGIASQTVQDIADTVYGDKEAAGRVLGIAATLAIPAAAKEARAKYLTEGPAGVPTVPPDIQAIAQSRIRDTAGEVAPSEASTLATIPESLQPATLMPKSFQTVLGPDRGERRAILKSRTPTVPETPPEVERDLTVIEEIRQKGLTTKEKIRSVFPQLSREEAARFRDQAFPREKVPDNLSKADVNRLFLDRLNEESEAALSAPTERTPDASQVIQTTEVHGDVRPQPEQGVRALPEQEGGAGVQPQTEGGLPKEEAQTPVTPQVEPLPTPGTSADEFNAVYGPRLDQKGIDYIASQSGDWNDLPPEGGVNVRARMSGRRVWVEASKREGAFERMGIATMVVDKDGTTILNLGGDKELGPVAQRALVKSLFGKEPAAEGVAETTAAPIEPSPPAGVEAGGVPITSETQLYHGSFKTDLTKVKPTKIGDFGSGVYVTTDPEFAKRFAESTSFGISAEERASRGSGKVYTVNVTENLKHPWVADETPLTKQEKDWWNKTEDGLEDGIETRSDLADAKSGRNFGPWEATELHFASKEWDEFSKAFGHDALIIGNEVLIKDPKLVRITKEPSAAGKVEPAAETATMEAKPMSPDVAAQKVQSEVKSVAREEGQRSAKDIKSELVERIQSAIDTAPSEADVTATTAEKIEIDIPGDGNFKIWNTKEALGEILKRAKRISTSSTEGPTVERRGISKEDKEQVAKTLAERKPVSPPTSEPSVGPGAASPESEFSQPTIDELIQPHLRPGMPDTPEAHAAEAPPATTLLGRVRDYFTTGQGHSTVDAVKGWIGTVAGKTLPKTTLADRQAGELGGRYVASRAAGAPMADVFVNDVLAGLNVDQAKFDASLKADNLLSIRDAFQAEADRLTQDPQRVVEAEVMQSHADHVNTLIGSKNFPFKTEQELQDYFQDPQVAEAVRRHIDNWKATIEPLYRITQNIDPSEALPTRGKYSSARINLNPIIEGEYEPARGTIIGSSGNILGTLRKRNPFARKAMGTGQSYVLNYAETMANSFARQLEIANKKAFEDRLVETGNAVISDIGKHPTLPDGGKTKPYPLIRRGFQNKSIYIRDTLSKEYEIAANVVLNPYRGSLLVGANKAFAQAALAGLTDATVHIENLGTALFQVPGATGTPLLVDSLLSAAGRMDIPLIAARMGLKSAAEIGRTRLMKYLPESIQSSINKALLKNMTQMASIAQINASRVPHGSRLIGSKQLGMAVLNADKATRMVLDDTFRNLVKQGLVKGTETNRREFINQAGNYNLRAQGPWMRFLRQTYIAPFATAGRNFATLGVRGISLNPGVEASGVKAAAALRANMLAKWIGTAALVATANYLITGKLMGRKGTPLGSIDTGQNDANGRAKYFNVAAFTGQSRALRTVGARGAIEARRLGLKPSDQAQAAVRDITNVGMQSVAGPGARFATIAATGYPPAVSVGRASEVVPPGEIQAVANVKEAAWEANPLLASIHEATKPGGNLAKAIERQIPRFTLTTGKPQAMVQNYPKIVSMAQANEFTESVIHKARQLPRDERHKFVYEQINRLEPQLRQHARQEMLRRKVYSRP